MYLILEGKLVISTQNRQIVELGSGQYVGEMALIESKPRSASARATSELLLMELSRHEFDTFLAAEPKALRALIHTLSARIRRYLEQLSVDIKRMSVLAHDMRHCLTPLGLVEGYLEDRIEQLDAAGDAAGSAQAQEQLQHVMRVSDEITSLIDQSLAQVRKINLSYKVERTDMAALLRQVVKNMQYEAQRAGQQIRLGGADDAVEMVCNALDIRRVMRNLLINGIEANADAGGKEVLVSLLDLDDRVEVKVQDSGGGVSPDVEGSLFRQPVTTKESGSGIGLVACREIIEDRHGGQLGYRSEPGQGSSFFFTLPKQQQE
jgi:signal transduction histidine kinase